MKYFIYITLFLIIAVFITCSINPVFAQEEPSATIHILDDSDAYENQEPEGIHIVGSEEETVQEPIDSTDQQVSDDSVLEKIVEGLKKLGVTIVNGVIKAFKLFANEVVARIVRIVTRKGEDNIVSSDVFPAGAIEYRVENSLVEDDSRIFVSFNSNTGGKTWHISEKAPGHGFTIRLSDVAVEPLDFDYWIVLVDGDGNFDMGIAMDDEPTEEELIFRFLEAELELLSDKLSFRFDEELKFKFKYKRKLKKNLAYLASAFFNLFRDEYKDIQIQAEVIGPFGARIYELEPLIKLEGNGEFSINLFKHIQNLREFIPGRYRLRIKIKDNEKVFLLAQNFTWGVLAINTNKSIYLPGEHSHIQMAVLDDQGDTVCDALLNLEIINPKGKKQVLSTLNRTIQYSGECGANNVTRIPDYLAFYETQEPGTYDMKLTATTINGTRSITDSFEVRDQVPFNVERIGPTRIYPLAIYEMKMIIKPNQDFNGEIIEKVPDTFKIIESSDFQLRNNNGVQEIVWQKELKQGETHELIYAFDAPDISPYLYLLGPLQIGSFYEARHWQIASDSPNRKIEQQINIIDQEYNTQIVGNKEPNDNSLGLIYWDADDYNGETIYFEALIRNAESNTASASLYTEDQEYVDDSTVERTATTYGRVRTSSAITLTDNTKYTVNVDSDDSFTYIKAARFIILQNASSITHTVSQVEVGDNTTTSNTYYATIGDDKLWNYTSASYDPTPTAYFEATLKAGTYEGTFYTEGPRDPYNETTTSQTGEGDDVDWTNPDNIASDDGSYAYSYIGKTNGANTYYLEARGFDFSAIPDGVTIKGIEMIMERSQDSCDAKGANDYIYDERIYIIREGTVQTGGTNKASTSADWPNGSYEYRYYGDSSADLWGVSDWTTDHIKDEANFGVAIQAQLVAVPAEGDCDARIDSVEIVVGYAETLVATASAALYTSGDTYVTEVELASASWELVRTSQSFSLTDGTDYKVRIKTSNASGTASIANAKVILEQVEATNGIDKTEVYHQYVNTASTSSVGAFVETDFYNELDKSNFYEWTYDAYFETTIKIDVSGTGYTQLYNGGSIANSQVETTNTLYERQRCSTDIWNDLPSTATDMDTERSVNSDTIYISSSWLIIQVASQQAGAGGGFFLVF